MTSYQESTAAFCKTPRCIVRPKCTEEVVEAVKEARRLACKVSVCGGGHTVNCMGDDALVIDLRDMRDVHVTDDGANIVIQGGSSLWDIAQAAAAHGMCCCLGTAKTVGVGALLYGGVGHMTRSHGLAVHNLLEVELVTATGDILRCKASEAAQRELFGSLCGAGPSFGVVTSLTLRGFPDASPWVVRHRSVTTSEDDTAVLVDQLCEVTRTAAAFPTSASADCLLYFPVPSELSLCVSTFARRHEPESLAATEALCASADWQSEGDDFEGSWLGMMNNEFYLGDKKVAPDRFVPPTVEPDPRRFRGFVLSVFLASMTKQIAMHLVEQLKQAPNRLSTVFIHHGGGKARRPTELNTRWEWSCVVGGFDYIHPAEDNTAALRLTEAWVRSTVKGLIAQPESRGVYATDVLHTDWEMAQQAHPGDVLHRLARLKGDMDPGDVFCFVCPVRMAGLQ